MHGAQERHDWGRLAWARARTGVTVHMNAMTGDDSRGRVRAGVTVHKNAMIGDDSRGRARAGVTVHKNVKKVKIEKPMTC